MALVVQDTGPGIPARDIDRIFERFYRVDRSRNATTGGTGIGLSIVRHVALNHGGTVSVESFEGDGSTFTLVLPIVPPNPTDAPQHADPQTARGQLMNAVSKPTKVLVVEDEESFLEALRIGLGREGFAIDVARDGNEALERFEAGQPDIVLLDVMLPRISGLDVCREIRQKVMCRSSWSPQKAKRSMQLLASRSAPTTT